MSTMEAYKAELARYLEGFGANVRRIRLDRNASQEAVSHRTRLHRTEIGKVEQGIVEPRLTTVVILADALGVSLDELVADLSVPVERKPSPHTRPWHLDL
ncbi:MAG: helix-turn-helix domain-containing protein [Solirubrobacteraceae bacterium]